MVIEHLGTFSSSSTGILLYTHKHSENPSDSITTHIIAGILLYTRKHSEYPSDSITSSILTGILLYTHNQ